MLRTAYCKINLTLEILGKARNDGFHDIKSVMHKIPFGDRISLEVKNGSGVINFACDRKDLCPTEKNLAYLAAAEYMKEYEKIEKKRFDVDIFLEKRVPAGAGLGGGSADAACVLDMLNATFEALDESGLEKTAARLGSDVVFCLDRYKSAYCSGRGEICKSIDVLPSGTCVVAAKPAESLNTSGIYRAYDEVFPENYEKNNSDMMISALAEKNAEKIARLCVNDFENVCIPRLEKIDDTITAMKTFGAYAAQMSGSGSAVFGLFDEKKLCEKCKNALSEGEYDCVEIFSPEDFEKMYMGE